MLRVQQEIHTNFIDCGSSENCLRFTADAKGGPERLWFDFKLDCSQESNAELILELHHCQSLLGGNDAQGFIFPVWQTDAHDWERLDEPQRIILEDGRFIFRWSVAMPNQFGRLAACYPYSRKDLDAYLQQFPETLHCVDLGVSAQGRQFPRIHNRIDAPGSQCSGVFICARQHASETTGSWILEGILSAFAQAQENDPMLWALPFIDLDGVEEGRYGKNHFPLDHNRSWYNSGLCHEVRIAMQEARRWSMRCRPAIFIDLHAPGFMEEDSYFFSGTTAADDKTQSFLENCQTALGDFASQKFIRQSSYQNVACTQVGIPNSLSANLFFHDAFNCISTTMECTYQSFKGKPATRDHYREIGVRLAACIREYCQQDAALNAISETNVISV